MVFSFFVCLFVSFVSCAASLPESASDSPVDSSCAALPQLLSSLTTEKECIANDAFHVSVLATLTEHATHARDFCHAREHAHLMFPHLGATPVQFARLAVSHAGAALSTCSSEPLSNFLTLLKQKKAAAHADAELTVYIDAINESVTLLPGKKSAVPPSPCTHDLTASASPRVRQACAELLRMKLLLANTRIHDAIRALPEHKQLEKATGELEKAIARELGTVGKPKE